MSRRFFIILIFCALLLLWSVPAAGAEDFSLGGYVKSYLYLSQPVSVQSPSFAGSNNSLESQLSTRFRIRASYSPSARVRLNAAYDLAPRFQSERYSSTSLLYGHMNPFSYRAVDWDSSLYASGTGETENFVLGQNLDRASITLQTNSIDFTMGRQAIAWGSARVFNPTDVLAPFTFEALDTEDRIGIDAIRARIAVGILSEIDLGYVFGEDFKFANSAFFARTFFNVKRTDLSLLVTGFRKNLLLGFDLARSIGGAGYWTEASYVFSNLLDEEERISEDGYFRASTGLDYNLTGDLYVFTEYHFNGAGAALPGEYMAQFGKRAYTEGSVYLMGRHYFTPGLVYQYTPLTSVSFESIFNVTDPSFILAPQVEYNIAQSVYVSAGAFIGIGEKPVAGGISDPIILRSEFGGYPDIYFASLRRYF